jgi:glycosyltransferase involved in cell wall biosynthesis
MSSARAPVAYFAFNRPAHTTRTLAALATNSEAIDTDLHVFVDGARDDAERVAVAEVARVARSASGFRSVRVSASEKNLGLYAAITTGVARVISEAKRVIVVEDDILVSAHFLGYMNAGLDRFETERSVGSIHGYAPPMAGLPDYFFLRGGDCWGWATWADRWALFNPDAPGLLRDLVRRGELGVFSSIHGIQALRHLIRRSRNLNQSWAAHWNASLFLESRLTLHPGVSFVQNIGNDGSGTHSAASDQYRTPLRERFDSLPPVPMAQDAKAARMLRDFYEAPMRLPLIGDAIRSVCLGLLRTQARVLARKTAGTLRTAGETSGERIGRRSDD